MQKIANKTSDEYAREFADVYPGCFVRYYLGLKPAMFHLEAYEFIQHHPKALLLLPAEHGKTDYITIGWTAWAICQNRNVRIGMYAYNASNAENYMGVIRDQLATNEKIIGDYGEFKPVIREIRKWNTKEMTIERENTMLKDPTIAARGYGAGMLSRRHDIAILDDILIYNKNCQTPEARQGTVQWFTEVVVPMIDEGGRIIVPGTVQAMGDLYDWMEAEGGFAVLRKKALISEKKRVVLWPEGKPFEHVMDKKNSMTIRAFSKRYQQEKTPEGEGEFDAEAIEKLKDHSRVMVPAYDPKDYPEDERLRIVIGIDPAVGKTRRAKFFVLKVIGVDKDGKEYLLHLVRRKMSIRAQAKLIVAMNEAFAPEVIVVENNSQQRYFVVLLEDLKLKGEDQELPIKGVLTGKEKADLDSGIPQLSNRVLKKLLVVPWGDQRSRRLSEYLLSEMRTYPEGDTSDCLMAWFVARKGITKYIKKKEEKETERKPGNLYDQGGWKDHLRKA